MLDTSQTKAVEDFLNKGVRNILVTAPAGTGKTFCCIEYARKYLSVYKLANYEKILVLTFSRNARAQIVKELNKFPITEIIYKHVEINNYHSFMKKYIDAYRDIVGITQPIQIVDSEDLVEEFALAKNIKFNINLVQDFLVEKDDVAQVNFKSKYKIKDFHLEDYNKFINFIKGTGKICFELFGFLFYEILKKSDELARYIAHDYPIMILDEFQDTDYFQYELIKKITKYTKNIFFADPFQMIYGFRGADYQRVEKLKELFPDIRVHSFDTIFRYKDKWDIIEILRQIRANNPPNYSNLVNGELITLNIEGSDSYHVLHSPALLTKACWSISAKVKKLMPLSKSVCVLVRDNATVDRLTSVFVKQGIFPRVVSDTSEMLLMTKCLKHYFEDVNVECRLNSLLTIVALCKNVPKIEDEDLVKIKVLTSQQILRKRKNEFNEFINSCKPYLGESDVQSKKQCINELISWIENQKNSSFDRLNFLKTCNAINQITPKNIDNKLLQKQYINSFSNIVPGLYVTTIHQSKGREFDYVFILDVENIFDNSNLLYVSHSRMKEKIFPVIYKFVQPKW